MGNGHEGGDNGHLDELVTGDEDEDEPGEGPDQLEHVGLSILRYGTAEQVVVEAETSPRGH